MAELSASLLPALAGALVHALWQGALIGAIAWAALRLLRDAAPQARYAVACVCLLVCVLLPAWHVVAVLVGDMAGAMDFEAGRAAVETAAREWRGGALLAIPAPASGFASHPATPWLVGAWAAGAGLLLARMAAGLAWVGLQRRRSHARTGGPWQARLDALAGRINLRRPVALHLCDHGHSPVTAGWWRPFVLLPASVAAGMPVALVEALLAHELAHVRRHDYLVNLMQELAEALLFFHPVVWWLSARIRCERERIADEIAAEAIGDRRRLAVALAELDRLTAGSPAFPTPHLAQAAHGGQLMSRIRHLVRPASHPFGAGAVVPLACLALAAVAFAAQAIEERAPRDGFVRAPAAVSTPAPIRPSTALPAPGGAPSKSGALAEPGASYRGSRAEAAPTGARDADGGYALVREGEEGFAMSGRLEDVDAIRAAQRSIDGDFIWVMRDGKAWIVEDPDTVARARQAWRAMEPLETRMQELDARMRPHGERMQALSRKMETLHAEDAFDSPEAREATARMEALAAQMEALSLQQVALAARMQGARDAAELEALQRKGEALQDEQRQLSERMERDAGTLQALGERMEAQHAPMEALGKQMEAAGRPMESIGREMEVVGKQIEREAGIADAAVRALVDDAAARGLLRPAPGRQ